MIEDLRTTPSVLDDLLTRQSMAEERIAVEAARMLADLLSHMRFLLANGGSPLSNREQAMLDLLEIAQDLPLAAHERRRVLHGLCVGYSVAECCERTRKELASASHLAAYDPRPVPVRDMVEAVRPADSLASRVLKILGGIVAVGLLCMAVMFGYMALAFGFGPPDHGSKTEVSVEDMVNGQALEKLPEDVQEPSR